MNIDGEKPNRHRDSEFEAPPSTRAALMETWESGWRRVFAALEPLTEADLTRTVWKTLSIPRGKSTEFHLKTTRGKASQR